MAATGIQFWVNGPVTICVGTASGNVLEALGISEAGVRVDINGSFEPVHSDDLGPGTPRDMQYFAEHAIITFDLNQWDQDVWSRLSKRINLNSANPAGYYLSSDPGSLMLTEGHARRILIPAPYGSSHAAFAGMPAYNFLQGWLQGPYNLDPLGTRYKRKRVVIQCLPQKRTDVAPYNFVLFNSTTTGVPAGVPV